MKRKENDRWIAVILGILFLTPLLLTDEITHEFKNPSFSGVGTSAHYLTIENQEKSRREKLQDDIEAALKAEQRALENTTLAKFNRNLESRIYSTLAKDISESLFNYDNPASGDNPIYGEIELEGNIIQWLNNGTTITLTIIEMADGVEISRTTITIPVGSFGGCVIDCET